MASGCATIPVGDAASLIGITRHMRRWFQTKALMIHVTAFERPAL
jgi:hypothetical protein